MGDHARLSPSNHRWPHCPGSVREEEQYEDVPGSAAIDGTGSHLLLELCLTNNVRAEKYLGEVIGQGHEDEPHGWYVEKPRCDRVQMCLDYVSTRVKFLQDLYPGSTVTVEAESRSNPGDIFGRDDWYGTCDITITVKNAHGHCLFIEVIDYKDGREFVHAEGNSQLIGYLGGKIQPYLSDKMEIMIAHPCQFTIVQPKTEGKKIRSHTCTHDYLWEELKGLALAADKTDDPKAPLIPDNRGGKGHCRWCKHRENCTALEERDVKELKNMSTELIPAGEGSDLFAISGQLMADPESLSSDQLTKLIDMEPGVLSMFTRAREELETRVRRGDDVEGWEIGYGNATRVWGEPEEVVVKKLKAQRLKKDDIYPPKLISPAQYLKLKSLKPEQKKRIEEELIVTKAGNEKLVRVAKKEKISADEMFAEERKALDFSKPAPSVDFGQPAPTLDFGSPK